MAKKHKPPRVRRWMPWAGLLIPPGGLLTRPGRGHVPYCDVCGRLMLCVYHNRRTREVHGWCDHGRCDPAQPEASLIERRFVRYLRPDER